MPKSNDIPSVATATPPLARRFGYALKRAQQALHVTMDRALQPSGLTMAQYAMMCALEAEPGMSNARLAKAAFVTAQTMQGVVAILEREGLIARRRDPSHARILKADLTPQGLEVLCHAHCLVKRVELAMVDSVGEHAVSFFTVALNRCAEDLTRIEALHQEEGDGDIECSAPKNCGTGKKGLP